MSKFDAKRLVLSCNCLNLVPTCAGRLISHLHRKAALGVLCAHQEGSPSLIYLHHCLMLPRSESCVVNSNIAAENDGQSAKQALLQSGLALGLRQEAKRVYMSNVQLVVRQM